MLNNPGLNLFALLGLLTPVLLLAPGAHALEYKFGGSFWEMSVYAGRIPG